MKLAFIMMLMIACVTCQVVIRKTCQNKNPVLNKLQLLNPAIIYPRPVPESLHCSPEWSLFGTCCNPKQLLAYVQANSKVIDNAVASTVTIVSETSNLVNQLIAHSAIAFKQNSKELKKNPVDHAIGKTFSNWVQSSTIFNMVTSKVNGSKNLFESLMTTCWDHMKAFRASSTCSTCSGRSEAFFKDGKIIIDQNTCSQVLENCGRSFNQLVAYLDFSKAVFKGIQTRVPGNLELIEVVQQLDKRYEAISELKLFDLLTTYAKEVFRKGFQHSPVDEQLRAITEAQICGRILNLSSGTFIEYFSKLIQNEPTKKIYSEALQRIKKILTPEQLSAAEKLTDLHSTPNKRILTANWVPASTPFAGDVTVVPPVPASIDSSYTAFLGAIGSGGNEGSRPVPHLPINMTMHFP